MKKRDLTPWLLLPGIMLTLSSVTLLAPHQTAAQAASPAPTVKPQALQPSAYDDGDGDELLEHWGDPKYAREEQRQMAGIAFGLLVLLGFRARRRRSQHRCEVVSLPSEADFLKQDSRARDTRKAA